MKLVSSENSSFFNRLNKYQNIQFCCQIHMTFLMFMGPCIILIVE